MPCPFCRKELPDLALVCAACGRDTAIPESLVAERAELLAKRDALRSELADGECPAGGPPPAQAPRRTGIASMECPFCAETIKDEAIVCKHCSRDLRVVLPVITEIQETVA